MVNMDKLREYAAELGFWPATDDPEVIAGHRRALAADNGSSLGRVHAKYGHHREEKRRQAEEEAQFITLADIYEGYYPDEE